MNIFQSRCLLNISTTECQWKRWQAAGRVDSAKWFSLSRSFLTGIYRGKSPSWPGFCNSAQVYQARLRPTTMPLGYIKKWNYSIWQTRSLHAGTDWKWWQPVNFQLNSLWFAVKNCKNWSTLKYLTSNFPCLKTGLAVGSVLTFIVMVAVYDIFSSALLGQSEMHLSHVLSGTEVIRLFTRYRCLCVCVTSMTYGSVLPWF